MKLDLITYGLGDKLDLGKFQPIKNRDRKKPVGGLWASPVGSGFGWKDWCEAESYGNLDSFFEFQFEGRVLVIDKLADLGLLAWTTKSGYSSYHTIDFEFMVSQGWQAILLTERGQNETRFSHPLDLYGWDCECVLVMDAAGILVPA